MCTAISFIAGIKYWVLIVWYQLILPRFSKLISAFYGHLAIANKHFFLLCYLHFLLSELTFKYLCLSKTRSNSRWDSWIINAYYQKYHHHLVDLICTCESRQTVRLTVHLSHLLLCHSPSCCEGIAPSLRGSVCPHKPSAAAPPDTNQLSITHRVLWPHEVHTQAGMCGQK